MRARARAHTDLSVSTRRKHETSQVLFLLRAITRVLFAFKYYFIARKTVYNFFCTGFCFVCLVHSNFSFFFLSLIYHSLFTVVWRKPPRNRYVKSVRLRQKNTVFCSKWKIYFANQYAFVVVFSVRVPRAVWSKNDSSSPGIRFFALSVCVSL